MSSSSRVPTLAELCLESIAHSIEKYPPQCFSILAESEWNDIIRKRHHNTAPGNRKRTNSSDAPGRPSHPCIGPTAVKIAAPVVLTGGLDGKGRTIPCLAEKVLAEIEQFNSHLANADVADVLCWKDCVEYKFKTGGGSRPRVLQYPLPVLVERLRSSGQDLLSVLQPPPHGPKEEGCSLAKIRGRREEILMASMKFLGGSIMTVPLLSASGVGKSVKKFVKEAHKLYAADRAMSLPQYIPGIQSPRPDLRLKSPLEYLENLLSGWKAMASISGIKCTVNSKMNQSSSAEQYSGQSRRTSDEQHSKDMKALQECHQWRDLYRALSKRETTMIAQHGEKMRRMRKEMDSDRPKISKVGTAHRNPRDVRRMDRHDAILSKAKGVRVMMASATKAKAGTSKMQALRQEVAFKKSRQGPVGTGAQRSTVSPPLRKAEPKRSFGASVAAHASTRRTVKPNSPSRVMVATQHKGLVGSVGARAVDLGKGRSMSLPKKPIGSKSTGAGVFSAIAEKKRKAATIEAYRAKQRRENDLTPRFKKR